MGPRRTTCDANCSSTDRLRSALPHLGTAWSAGLGADGNLSFAEKARRLRLRKADEKEENNLTHFGHPCKTAARASLRSDNCPTIPDECPTIIGSLSDNFGLGVRNHRNAQLDTNRTIARVSSLWGLAGSWIEDGNGRSTLHLLPGGILFNHVEDQRRRSTTVLWTGISRTKSMAGAKDKSSSGYWVCDWRFCR